MRFQTLAAATKKGIISWDVTQCNLADVHRKPLPDYSHPRRQKVNSCTYNVIHIMFVISTTARTTSSIYENFIVINFINRAKMATALVN
jgi:hypothetical protein